MSKNIYLTGFMGAGKSSVGRELAAILGRKFLDLDQAVEKTAGRAIRDIFENEGEAAFRELESRELGRAAAKGRLVVATGGGLPVSRANRRLMKQSGRVVFLEASLATCRARLGKAEVVARPLWSKPQALKGLYEERGGAYQDCHLPLVTEKKKPLELAREIAAWLLPEKRLSVNLGGVKRPLFITPFADRELAGLCHGRRLALLTDNNLACLHLARLAAGLPKGPSITLPPGEKSKSLAGAGKVYAGLAAAALGRHDLLVALGGGMITDLGAFAAATFKRGMDFILVSTSLVGCVDAAIGGKAAVNLIEGKNLVGAFTRPAAVVLDLLSLATLKRPHLIEGMAEAYKTGLVAAPELAELCAREMKALLAGDLLLLARVVELAAAAKVAVVGQDFTEGGRRMILNFGHTYGHAVETANHYRVSHGKAVAAGMLAAGAVSHLRGLMSRELLDDLALAVKPMCPPLARWPRAAVAWPIMANDKKNQGGKVTFVLLREPGVTKIVNDLSREELAKALTLAGEIMQ